MAVLSAPETLPLAVNAAPAATTAAALFEQALGLVSPERDVMQFLVEALKFASQACNDGKLEGTGGRPVDTTSLALRLVEHLDKVNRLYPPPPYPAPSVAFCMETQHILPTASMLCRFASSVPAAS
jgi:hypothetical protein